MALIAAVRARFATALAQLRRKARVAPPLHGERHERRARHKCVDQDGEVSQRHHTDQGINDIFRRNWALGALGATARPGALQRIAV